VPWPSLASWFRRARAVRIAAAALVFHGTADEAVPFSMPRAWPPRYRMANCSPFPIGPTSVCSPIWA
jgi:fermentation-respiration switch protein FrsA (DUF1100 family)